MAGDSVTNPHLFPQPAYQNVTQVISLASDDGQCSEDIVCQTVSLLSPCGPHEKSSSMLKFSNEVDFSWDNKFYQGQLVALHRNGLYRAYALNGTAANREYLVRVVSKTTPLCRLIIRGMKGPIQDLAFACIDSEILLAIVDEQGNLFVHQIFDEVGVLREDKYLVVTREVPASKNSGHRVVWVPFLPEEGDDDEDAAKLLALTLGPKVELWNVGIVNDECGSGPFKPGAVTNGFIVIEEHKSTIVDCTFSPDGIAFVSASLDGTVLFFGVNIYLSEQPRCLHNWKPHDGKPISSILFLDNHKNSNPESQFWKYVVTGSDNNTELKIWSCQDWTLIQTVFIINKFSGARLKATIDETASFIVLSDQENKVLYLLKIHLEKDESTAYFNSVSAYLVPYPFLSFAIEFVKGIKTIEGEIIAEEDVEDELDDEEVEIREGELLSMYVVQPKSLKHAMLRIVEEDHGKLALSTFCPTHVEPPTPVTLMTPKEFASPAKPEAEIEVGIIKQEPVDAVVSGGSSPSREVQDILHHAGENAPFSEDDVASPPPATQVPSVPAPSEWPNIPLIPDSLIQKEPVEPVPEVLLSKKRESLGVSTLKTTDYVAPEEELRVALPTDVDVKLDAILAALVNQDAQIQELRSKLREKEDNRDGDKLQRSLDAYSKQLRELFLKQDVHESERQESLLYAVSQTVENLIAVKLEEIVPMEIKKNVLPEILSDMEGFKRSLHVEMTQQLSATDHLLKENITKLVQSKSVMEVLSMSLTSVLRKSIAEMCKDLVATFVIPRMEKFFEQLFQQVHETFTVGTRECIGRLHVEVDSVKEELRKGELSLRQATEINKNISGQLQLDLQKGLLSVSDKLKKQLSETIQREMLSSKAMLESVVSSRAVTPAISHSVDRHAIISQHLHSKQYNAAFKEALSASNLDLVVFTCGQIAPEVLFNGKCPLEQPVLLSLIQQLTADMANHTDLKCNYLTEAILRLEGNDPTTKEHMPTVINDIQKQINSYLANNASSKHCRDMQRILMVLKIFASGK